jgi:hypothetical protein
MKRTTAWGCDKECLAMGRFYNYLSQHLSLEAEKVGRVMAWAEEVFEQDQLYTKEMKITVKILLTSGTEEDKEFAQYAQDAIEEVNFGMIRMPRDHQMRYRKEIR